MPTVSSSGSVMAERAAQLLGRATEVTTRLLTTTMSPSQKLDPVFPYSSTVSPLSQASYSTMETLARNSINIRALTTTTTTTTASTLATHELEMVTAPMPSTSLYSLEELGHWSTASNCTALIHALLASFSVILVSELGDKTFIITAIMAMKNSRSLVFISSATALLLMTILSVGMGVAVAVVPELYTHYASIVLFLCFGLKMLKESYDMSTSDKEGGESEFDEVKRSLEKEVTGGVKPAAGGKQQQQDQQRFVEDNTNKSDADRVGTTDGVNAVEAPTQSVTSTNWWAQLVRTLYVAPIVINVFTMVFVAEWGDRSQISTVILAAREDVVGVFIGSLSGHVFCTGLAVIGGRFVADMISVRTMTLLGGIIFLLFAAFAIFTGPDPRI